jgi:hypothetical protein
LPQTADLGESKDGATEVVGVDLQAVEEESAEDRATEELAGVDVQAAEE